MLTHRILRCAAGLSLAGLLLLLALLTSSPGSADRTPLAALLTPTVPPSSITHTVYLPLVERHIWVPAPLQNGSFEGGYSYWRDPATGIVHNPIFVPDNWVFFWDPSYNDPEVEKPPEMRIIQRVAPYVNPPRIYSGTQALMWFTFFHDSDVGVYQQVPAEIGHLYRAEGYAHVWYSQRHNPYLSEWKDKATGIWYAIPDGDPGMEVMIGIDPAGGQDPWSEDVVWTSENIYDQYGKVSVETVAEAPTVTVFIRARTLYPFKHADAYWDEVSLEVLH